MALRHRLYSPRLERALRSLGLYGAVRGLYWRARRVRTGRTYTAEISGKAVRYAVPSHRDLHRIEHDIGRELPVLEDLAAELRPGDVFWDVGASIGTFAGLAAAIVEDGAVVAFEPSPGRAEVLEANAAVDGHRFRVLRSALADTDGTIDIDADDRFGIDAEEGHAERRSGDALIAEGEVPAPSVVKIDVEGAEGRVVEGLSDAIENGPVRALYIEIHDKMEKFGDSGDALLERLREEGFEIEVLFDRNQLSIKASRPQPSA